MCDRERSEPSDELTQESLLEDNEINSLSVRLSHLRL